MTDLRIDRQIFNGFIESINNDLDFLAEMILTYFNDSPRQIAEMRSALLAGHHQDLTRAAHSLKSNSAVFGATTLVSLCKTLEESGKAGVINSDTGSQIDRIEMEYQQVQNTIRQIQQEL
jgi:HPt (histidine-containing phosphotransfer) domain-containing protein